MENVVSFGSRFVLDGAQVVQRDVVSVPSRLPRSESTSSRRPVLGVAGDVDSTSRILGVAVEGADSNEPGTDLRERKPFVTEDNGTSFLENHHEGVPR